MSKASSGPANLDNSENPSGYIEDALIVYKDYLLYEDLHPDTFLEEYQCSVEKLRRTLIGSALHNILHEINIFSDYPQASILVNNVIATNNFNLGSQEVVIVSPRNNIYQIMTVKVSFLHQLFPVISERLANYNYSLETREALMQIVDIAELYIFNEP
jgi:hypothetical protein